MSINDLISSKVSPTVSNASVQTRPPPVLCNMESQASSDLILCSTKSQTDDAEMTVSLYDDELVFFNSLGKVGIRCLNPTYRLWPGQEKLGSPREGEW